MYSIGFPDMLASETQANLVADHKATAQNLILMLKSDRFTLFGDPYYGTIIKRMLFEQNNMILQDIVIDEIFSCIITFMPQIKINRNDITLEIHPDKIYANIKCINLIDYQVNLYKIKLTDDDEI